MGERLECVLGYGLWCVRQLNISDFEVLLFINQCWFFPNNVPCVPASGCAGATVAAARLVTTAAGNALRGRIPRLSIPVPPVTAGPVTRPRLPVEALPAVQGPVAPRAAAPVAEATLPVRLEVFVAAEVAPRF